MSSRPKRKASQVKLKEPPQKCASEPLPGEWRYINGPDHTVYIIHLPTLQLHAPECLVTKILVKDPTKGLKDTEPVFVSAPTWYVEQVCNISQVYSGGFASFPGQDIDPVCDVLEKVGWQPKGDLRIPHTWAQEIKARIERRRRQQLAVLLTPLFVKTEIPPSLELKSRPLKFVLHLSDALTKENLQKIDSLVSSGCTSYSEKINCRNFRFEVTHVDQKGIKVTISED